MAHQPQAPLAVSPAPVAEPIEAQPLLRKSMTAPAQMGPPLQAPAQVKGDPLNQVAVATDPTNHNNTPVQQAPSPENENPAPAEPPHRATTTFSIQEEPLAQAENQVQAALRAATQAAMQPLHRRRVVLPTQDEIEASPWKFAGYPQFTRWVASDQAWFITRRFSTVNARVVLYLQNKVVELERDLNKLDKKYSQSKAVMGDDDNTHNGSFALESFPERTIVLDKLVIAVREYNSFVNDYSQLASRPPVRKDDVETVKTWLENHDNAIQDLEAAYMKEEYYDDLIPVYPKPRSWFRKVLEKTSWLSHRPLSSCLSRQPSDPLIKEKEHDTTWHNDTRVEWLSATVIGMVGLGMLIGPIWALDKVGPSNARLSIISGFIVAFYILVGIATTAKVFESLAAVAAYSAVLMVFMQIQKD